MKKTLAALLISAVTITVVTVAFKKLFPAHLFDPEYWSTQD